MKKLAFALATVFSSIALSATALAAGFWKVTISSPANTTNKTFNVQYTTSSTDPSDDFSVELFQNGTSVGSQTTTKENGDSGAFQVTVPTTGTYNYFIKATNSNDPAARSTSPVSVTVSNPPAGTVTTVFVNNGTNTGTTAGTGGQGGGTAQGGAAGASGSGGGGAVAGAQTGGQGNGHVGDQTATTDTSNNGDVLGTETQAEEKKATETKKKSTNPLWYVLGLAVIGGIGYGAYTMRMRAGKE